MITLLSPAKDLNFQDAPTTADFSIPEKLETSDKIIRKLRSLSRKKLMELMDISKNLAELNQERYVNWQAEFSTANAKQAVLAFNGDVYRGLKASEFTQPELDFAQGHLRILSGLHGMLRPLDLIQPYRLEMGSRLPVGRKKNLYEIWKADVTDRLNEELGADGVLVNLASKEYFSVVDESRLNARVITPVFKDMKNGQYKVLFLYAKLMRGAMAGYIVREGIDEPEALKEFAEEGYGYNESLSEGDTWVFTRG